MLAIAADWRPGAVVRSIEEIMNDPALAHYIAGWPSEGDVGVVAENGAPVGAAWWRFLSADDPGYGFVGVAIPELSIGVVETARGQGVGTMMLAALIDEADRRGLSALSLSVEHENPAGRLYRRLRRSGPGWRFHHHGPIARGLNAGSVQPGNRRSS